jgi:periplasmic divalent cation tolerance protein
MTDLCVVILSAPSEELAETLARTLIEERFAACVHLLPRGRSLYRWQGKVCDDSETSLLVKTTRARAAALLARARDLHPYEVPEVLVLPVVDGLPEYLEWVRAETRVIEGS